MKGLTLVMSNKTENIIILIKTDYNSEIFCLLNPTLNNTANFKSFRPF